MGFDFDPTLTRETVTITNADGIRVSVTPTNPAYVRRFFNRGLAREINVQDDNEAIDAANYLLNRYKQPTQRVEQLVLDPAANPDLWPVVLTVEIGDRVTVVRRPKAANSGVGIVMSGDYFVEKISHDGIDMEKSTWRTVLQLSPVDLSQVGFLDDAVYGLLDSTMILAY